MGDRKWKKIEDCLEAFSLGRLTEADLRQVMDELCEPARGYQDLLYLQTSHTSLDSPVHGMSIVLNGEISDGPQNPNEWPYETPLQAIQDGWRVVQFPNMALIMDESKAYGLGCEFILEKWRQCT